MQRNRVITAIATASVLLLASAGTVFAMQTNGQGNFLMQTSGQNHDDGNGNDFAPLPTGYTVQPLAGELDVPVALDCELPPGVVSTALQASQGGTLEDAQIDFDDVVTVYEIGATGRHGRELEVDVFSDGNLEEIEIVLSERRAARIPSEVTELLNRAFPGFEIDLIEKSIRPAGNGLLRNFYEFDGESAEGKNLDVEINQRGTVYTVEPASLQVPAIDVNFRCGQGGVEGAVE